MFSDIDHPPPPPPPLTMPLHQWRSLVFSSLDLLQLLGSFGDFTAVNTLLTEPESEEVL